VWAKLKRLGDLATLFADFTQEKGELTDKAEVVCSLVEALLSTGQIPACLSLFESNRPALEKFLTVSAPFASVFHMLEGSITSAPGTGSCRPREDDQTDPIGSL
jgi:hypothetical protein